MKDRNYQAAPAVQAPKPQAAFVAPKLERLGTLKELTKAFTGNGTDTFIAGMSKL